MLFAFGYTEGAYYIANGKQNHWKALPQSLVGHIRENYYVLQTISLGEHDAWFYKDAPRTGHTGSLHRVSPSVAVHYPRVNEICQSDEAVKWVAFGPDGKWVVKTDTKTLSSEKNMMRDNEDTGHRVPLRCATFGHNGAWLVVEKDGAVRSEGVSQKILTLVNKKPVRNVQLSPRSSTMYFIEYVDGEVTWFLPTSWHEDVNKVSRMPTRLHQPTVPGLKTVAKRIIFAFSPRDDAFCISNGDTAKWKGMNTGMVDRLKRKGTMRAFSVGDDGACFWRQDDSSWVSDSTKMAYPKVWQVWQSGEKINWVAFGPDGYFVMDTEKRIYASRAATLLRKYKDTGNQIPLRCASFGYGGAWVTVENDGTIRSSGLSEKVLEKLRGKNVRNVQLARTDPDRYYVEYIDGTRTFFLPKGWHEDVIYTEKAHPASSK